MTKLRDPYDLCRAADEAAGITSGPHGWIQWKGTDVCMDVHCSCGELTHIDADFCYTVKCGKCGKLWAVCQNVRFIEITAGEAAQGCEPRESTL